MKTKFLSVIAAIAIAMTSFVSLTITASAAEWTSDSSIEGIIVVNGDVVVPRDNDVNIGENGRCVVTINGNLTLEGYDEDDEDSYGAYICLKNRSLIIVNGDVTIGDIAGIDEYESPDSKLIVTGTIYDENEGIWLENIITTDLENIEYVEENDEHYEYFTSGNKVYKLDGESFVETTLNAVSKAQVNVTGITLNNSNIDLIPNETASLSVTVTPEEASDKSVTWTSSDDNVATVDENGNVTAKGLGTATITATSKMENSVSATCNVTVTNPPSTAEIAVVDKDAYIDENNEGYLRILTQVTFPAEKAVEYYGTWFIPADLQSDSKYNKAEVKLNNADNAIESGNIFASDLRYIPSDKHKTAILAIPFVKLIGEENLATTSVETSVLENLNETSSNK